MACGILNKKFKISKIIEKAFMILIALFVVSESFFLNYEDNTVHAENIVYKFDYTGNYQEFVVPETGTYKIQLWGAQGGSSLENNQISATNIGGYGAYTAGLVELEKDQVIYIYVGGKGTNGKKSTIVAGGWNGGGRGDYDHSDDEAAGAGGGATDIRLSIGTTGLWNDFDSLKSRIMVAAGGGGTSWVAGYGHGGSLSSPATNVSAGATQTTGYAFGTGQPGVYARSNTTVGGGGGGYYGGYATNSTALTNGSGGSSFISGFEGSNAISEESTSINIIHTGQSVHYSGISFSNGIMIRGNGYADTENGLIKYDMPNPAGGTFATGTGKTGNGYAIIEYIDEFSSESYPNFAYTEGYTYTYSYTGNYQTFVAPADGVYKLEAWGARGGYGLQNSSGKYAPGYGGYVSGEIHLNKGDTFYVYVGQAGYNGRANCKYCGGYGGWNGGGQGGNDKNHDSSPDEGGGGGGATDFRLVSGTWNNFDSLRSRILIAAGGGGSTYSLTGYPGGLYLNNTNTYNLGQGQSGFAADTGSGGGGGGYFGGISQQCSGCRGFGGTSYISGSSDDLAITEDSTSSSITLSNNSTHYSGIVFDNATKIAGNASMPNWAGTATMTGNNNHGYAKVTIVSLDYGTPKLSSITVSGGVFSQSFDPDTYTYDILVDSENTTVEVNATALYEQSTIFKGIGELTLEAGTNTHYIGIISDTGEVSIYTLNITRPASSYKYLEDIKIDGSSIPAFDPETFEYTVELSAEQETVNIEAILGRPSQQVSGVGEIEVGFGTTTHEVEVISEDGNNLTVYTINFVKPNSSKLKSLKVEEYVLTPTFDPDTLEYTVDVPAGILSLDVEAIPYDSSATVTISGNGYLKRNNVITITVNQETAGTTTYKVTVNREGIVTQTTYEFSCTKTYQEFEAPGSGYYKIELWGAEGGMGHRNYRYVNAAGKGAYTTGTIWLTKGEKIYVYVGCKGAKGASVSRYVGGLGGYNGGGKGGDDKNHDSAPDAAGGGGGATDIRLVSGSWDNFESLKSRIMVAGGGSGSNYGKVGLAGGLYLNNTNTYSLGLGQSGFAATSGSQGGGGGYFGGKSIQVDGGQGYGGTSYVSGYDGMLAISEDSTSDNVVLTDSSIHYSGIEFTDIEVIDGASTMPSKTDGYTTGNTGDGYTRITLLPLPSENNYLSSITVKVNDEVREYTPEFDLETSDYYLEVGVDETRVTISAKPDDSTATIDGLGEHMVAAGENIIPITVTAENGDVRVYNVHITRPASDNPYPIDIIISGLVPSLCSVNEAFCVLEPATFDKDTNSYYITVPSRIKQLWFNVEKGHDYQIVSGEGKVSLDGGENIITIEIESEDGQNSVVYKYYVTRDMTGNTDLLTLDIIDPERTINYDPDITEYYLSVPNDYTSIKEMVIETDDPNASYVVVGNEDFETGMNQVSVIVTAQNGETKIYVLNVYREQSSNVYLSTLEVKNGETIYELTPEFNKVFTGTYQTTVPNDVTTVDINAIAEVDTTTVLGTGTKTLNTGNNEFTITTTAEDGSIEMYTLIVYREKNSNTNLTSLEVKTGETIYTLNPTYSNDVLEYTIDVPEGTSTVDITAVPEVSTTTYKLLNNNKIKVGTNTKQVMVIAEDGTSKTITITINRNASSNNYLSSLTVNNGTLIPEFDRETSDYTIEVENEITTITVTGVKEDSLATLKGNGKYSLQVGQNEISLIVTAEDGTERYYNINVTRKPSTNAYLSNISTSVGTLVPEFNKDTFEYTMNVENTVENIVIKAIPEVKTTTVTGAGTYTLESGSNIITLVTLAEDGVTTLTYTIDVVKDKSDNDNIKLLIMKEGILSPEFDSNVILYTTSVPNEVTEGNFIVELEDSKATYEILNNTSFIEGENEVIIRVTSESRLTKDYTVIVTRQTSEDNSNYLTDITTSTGTLNPTFDKQVQFYEMTVPYNINQITVNATKEDENATLTGNGTYSLEVGKNLIGLEVIGIDGKIRDYQILITREKNTEARLSALSINGVILSPNFDKDTYEYTLSTTETSLNFTKVQTVDSNAIYEIIGNENFVLGDNTVTIKVTAHDGITTKEYFLNVTKEKSNNNNLSSLSVVDHTITPTFNKATTLYTLTVPYEVNSVTIEATAEDPMATIVGDGSQVLEVGENQLVVEVTSESGNVKAYTIVVTKEGSSNNNIEQLIVNNGLISPEFDSATTTYDVTVPYEEESLDLTVILEDDSATYSIVDNDLTVGTNVVQVLVTAANGDIKTYTLNVTREEIQSALLKDLSINNYQMDQVFNSYVTNYDVTIDNEITSLELNIETLDKNATYVVSGNENFEVGTNVITIVVTSSDLVTTETYTINVNRQMYSNTFLDYLYTSEGDVTPTFDKYTLSYSIEVETTVETIELFAEAVDGSATVTGVGEHSLNKGENIIPITVATTSGVKRTYYVTVNRAKSNDNYLETLTVKAGGITYVLTPEFDKLTNNYELTLPSGIANVILTGTVSENATVSGLGTKAIVGGTNTLSIDVTSESGIVNTYTLVINRELSSNNYLTDLIPSAGSLEPEFNYTKTDYTINLDSGAGVLGFTYYTEDSSATVTGAESQVVPDGTSTRTIEVTAEDGTVRTYTITINKERTDNAKLSNLYVNGYSFDETFDPEVYEYHLTVPNSKKILLASEVIATPEDSNAKVTKSSNLTLVTGSNNEFVVTVTAPDGFTTQQYTIIVTRKKSSTASLASLSVSQGYLETNFNPNVYEYSWKFPKELDLVLDDYVKVTAQDSTSTITMTEQIDMKSSDEKVFIIKVSAEDGSSCIEYKLNVSYDLSNDATLKELLIDKGYYLPEFDPETYEYDVYEYITEAEINITATPTADTSFVTQGNGTVLLDSDTVEHTIVVTAEDGTIQNYVIRIHKTILTDTGLKNLGLNGLDDLECISDKCILSPTFNTTTYEYSIKVPYEYTSLNMLVETFNEQQTYKYKINDEYIENYQLPVGNTKVVIEVYDGMGTKTSEYTLNIERCKSNNTNLESLVVDGYELTPIFDKNTLEYDITIPNDIDAVSITAIAEDENAYVKVNGYNYLEEGLNDATITVIAPDGTEKTYIIHILRNPLYNSYIKNITVSTGIFFDLSPTFKQTTFDYTTTIPGMYETVTVEAVPVDSTTVITGTGEFDIVTGLNVVKLTATAVDGSTSVYTINIIKEASTNVNLIDLIVEEANLNPSFDSGITKYELTITPDINKLTIHPVLEDKTSSYIITGNENLIAGDNIVNVIVMSQDKSVSKTYQLTVHKLRSSNNYLSNIIVKDDENTYELNPEFNKETEYYDVQVDHTVEKVTIDVLKEDSNAYVTGIGEEYLAYGNNEKTITVTAEDGSVKTYIVNIYRNYNLNLKDIISDIGTISPTFDKDTLEYNMTLPSHETEITFIAQRESDKVKVIGSGTYNLSTGDNEIVFTVTAPDGKTKEYKVIVTKEGSDNNYIESLVVHQGIISPEFNKETTEYEVSVRNTVTSIGMDIVLEDSKSTYEVIGNENLQKGSNEVIVRVTAENGETRDYKINVILQEDSYFSNRLLSLSISEGKLTPDFDPDINYYAATVANSVENLTISATKENVDATVTGLGLVNLNLGRNIFQVQVTSQDGILNTYTIAIYREENSDATLSSLVVKNHSFSPIFNKLVENYEMSVSSEISSLDIEATPTDKNSTVEISGNSNLVMGENTITIKVTAPDGVTTKTYTIKVEKSISTNNYLSSLIVNGYTISPTFDKTYQGPYTVNVESNVNSIVIDATAEVETTTISGDGSHTLQTGQNIIQITATSESNDSRVYTVIINKSKSSNSYLENIILSDGTLTPTFDPDTLEYKVSVKDELQQITVTGKPASSTSVVEGNGTYDLVDSQTTIPITVEAEDGSSRTYNIVVEKETIHSSKIESLIVKDGELTPTFHKNTTSYSVLVPYEVTSLDMEIVLEDSNATYTVTGNSDFALGNNTVTITVTAIDGQTTTYTINAIRQVNASNYLKDLSVVGYNITPTFEKTTLYYEVTVPNAVEEVQIKASKEDTNSTLTGTGYKSLEYGRNTFYVSVTSVSGSVRTYTVVVNRKLEDENLLLILNSSLGIITPEFDPYTNDYELNIPEKTESIILSGTSSNNTTVAGLGEIEINSLEVEHQIVVTSQSGDTNTYNIKIIRQASSNTELESLFPSAGVLEYTNDETEYEIEVEDNITTISFTATPKDSAATVMGTELTNLDYGENTITITVLAEDGITTRTITIKVTRMKNINSIIPNVTELVLKQDETKQITYTLDPIDTSYPDVEWVSNDETVVSIDQNGNVTGLEVGYTSVKIVSKTDSNVFATITVYVIETEIKSSVYEVNRDGEIKYVTGIEPKTKLQDFIPNFDNNPSSLHLFDSSGVEIEDLSTTIGTNMVIKLIINNIVYDELIIIVRGDLNGDSYVTVADQTTIKNMILGKVEKTFIFEKASDVTLDDMVTVADMTKVKNYILGKESSLNK